MRSQLPRTQAPRTRAPRTLPARPSLRHLKLEAKRRLAAGEFGTLHDAQTAIACEYTADSVPDLAALMGPVIGCDGPRGTVRASNGGYGVLGQLIADVTGLPFAHAADELVLSPLGMRDSRWPAKAADIAPNAVTGYTLIPDGPSRPFRRGCPPSRRSPGSGPPGRT